ncbi:MAG: hypothetical protein J6I73_09765 [Treponema sp.]|nr:hypothetical protein [Treponema sp.]
MKKNHCASIIILSAALCAPLFSQVRPQKPSSLTDDIRLLRSARVAYRNGGYGTALRYAEEAKTARKTLIAWETYTLQNSLRPLEVRRANDALPDVLAVLQTREDYDAIEIINKYVRQKTASFFNNSAAEVVAYVAKRNAYPEADWLVGSVYVLEGEYALAKQYLLNAWSNAYLLDVSDEQYDILYDLANIAYIENDFDNYEKNLLLVLSDDSFFKNKNFNDALMLTIRNKSAGSMEKFFTLFRSDDYKSLPAYFKLSEYYGRAGENEKALKANALGVLTGFTKMYNAVKARNPEFEYADLSAFLRETAAYGDIVDWAEQNRVWQGFCDFAVKVRGDGNSVFANDIYASLAASVPDSFWKNYAQRALAEQNAP